MQTLHRLGSILSSFALWLCNIPGVMGFSEMLAEASCAKGLAMAAGSRTATSSCIVTFVFGKPSRFQVNTLAVRQEKARMPAVRW